MRKPPIILALTGAIVALGGCEGRGLLGEPVTVAAAGSLAAPLRVALDSFTARTGIPVAMHTAGSVELARRLIDLQEIPDVLALADEEVFPKMLRPEHVGWWATFARGRMVLAMAPNARHAAEIDSTSWWKVLALDDVEVGRSDPALDPAGYRAIMVLRLAERALHDSTIERSVLARSPVRNVRPKSADLVALLQTGALDYAFLYETSARAAKLRYVTLGPDVDLSDENRAAIYGDVAVRIPGKAPGSEIEVRGAPIRYALSVPGAAAHFQGGMRLVNYLISDDGRRVLRAAGLDAIAGRVENPRLKRIADSVAAAGERP
ncbi:MAG TPA: extracellular solute-binding protein [Gemmatimonadaceae bacterium]